MHSASSSNMEGNPNSFRFRSSSASPIRNSFDNPSNIKSETTSVLNASPHSTSSSLSSSNPVSSTEMLDLSSLTAAADAVEGIKNVFSDQIISAKRSRSPSSYACSTGVISLPPISKVFPEHFGVKNHVSLTFNPNSPGNLLPPAQVGHYPVYPHGPSNTSSYHMHPSSSSSSQLQSSQYSNALKKLHFQQQQQFNSALNYYNDLLRSNDDRRKRPASEQVPIYNRHFNNIDPSSYGNSIDRKRPYNHPDPIGNNGKNYFSSTKVIPSSNGPSPSRPGVPQNPVKNLVDSASISSGSTIHTKLNFRNFAMQLSSKSTNLTSNQSGTASADKEHFAAVMQDCVISTSVDFINSFPDYRPTVNNKLKPLKFIEFIQDQIFLHYNESTGFLSSIPPKDDLVFFFRLPDNLAAKHPEAPRFKIFRHSKTIGIAIYRQGQRIFPLTPEDIADFWSEIPRNKPIVSKEHSFTDLKEGDMILICRAYSDNLEIEADSLAEKASKVPLGGDLDCILPPSGHIIDEFRGETATVIAIIGSEFDEYMLRDSPYRIRHVIHVEKSGHTAIDEPWPYAITKHTLVVRPYLAMLYSDASKINRFSPTIEFILKKVKAAPIGESILNVLGKLSEIQHMAAGMVIGDKLRYWATGGACIVHLRRENLKTSEWSVSFPGIVNWDTREPSSIFIGEINIQDGDCLLLCCPEIRTNWTESEIVSVIKSRALWPEKFQIFSKRLKDIKNSKNGFGLYEITLRPQ